MARMDPTREPGWRVEEHDGEQPSADLRSEDGLQGKQCRLRLTWRGEGCEKGRPALLHDFNAPMSNGAVRQDWPWLRRFRLLVSYRRRYEARAFSRELRRHEIGS